MKVTRTAGVLAAVLLTAACSSTSARSPAPPSSSPAAASSPPGCALVRAQLKAYAGNIKADQAQPGGDIAQELATTAIFQLTLAKDAALAPPALRTAEDDLSAALASENSAGVTFALGEITKACRS